MPTGGHRWCGSAGQTQNQGNILGDRPCVRQSRHYRQHLGGNAIKEMMGQDSLIWKIDEQQGVYAGKKTWTDKKTQQQPAIQPQPEPQQQRQALRTTQQHELNRVQQQQQQPAFFTQEQPQQQQKTQQQQQEKQQQGSSSMVMKNKPVYDGQPTNKRCTGRSNQQTFSLFEQQ